MPRTGSNLLSDRLEASGVAGVPREYYNPTWLAQAARERGLPVVTARGKARQQLRRARLHRNWESVRTFEPASLHEYTRELIERRTTSNGVFSVKFHWLHLALLVDHGASVDQLFPGQIRWIYLTRHDRVARAVSFVRAAQSGAWSSSWNAGHRPESLRYDPSEIERALELGDRGDRGWAEFFATHNIVPIAIDFEELRRDPDVVTTRVLREAGVEASPIPASRPAKLTRQSDDLNVEWEARFRRDRPDLL